MIIQIGDVSLCFEKICKKAIIGKSTVVILVSFDVDSLCALHILVNLLKSENILYQIQPVAGFIQMSQIIDNLKENPQLRSIIMLNCGSLIDLTTKWFVQKKSDVRCYIFDNHRPIHHANVHSQKHIIIIDDGCTDLEQCPAPEDLEAQFQDNSEASESENDDDEEQYEIAEQNENDDELVPIGLKRKQKLERLEQRKLKKKLRLQRLKKIKNYYQGTWHGISSAYCLYSLAQQLNKETSQLLWYAVVGLTALFAQNKISDQQYRFISGGFILECMRINPQNQDNKDYEEFKPQTENNQVGEIVVENDYRFMLLKHWSLYDSMYYSTYLAPRLEIWKEAGKKQLISFISQLGIPLAEAKQQFRYMDVTIFDNLFIFFKNNFKKQLKEKIIDVAQRYELNDLLFQSFVKQISPKLKITAMDLAYCLSAVLSCPKIHQEEESKEQVAQEVPFEEQQIAFFTQNKNFYRAYDILKSLKIFFNQIFFREKEEQILEGIQRAIDFQKALLDEALFLISSKKIQTVSKMRYALITAESMLEKKFFLHPISLQKLALSLMEIYSVQKREQNSKPIVLCVQSNDTNSYLVVGVVQAQSFHNKNNFGTRFIDIAQENNLKIRQDDFETSVIEVLKEDYGSFINQLVLFE